MPVITRRSVIGAALATAVVLPLVGTTQLAEASTRSVQTVDPTSGRVRYGFNPGGWWRSAGQTPKSAYDQAVAAFGQPGFMRLWPNRFTTTWRGGLIPTYVDDAKTPVYINLGSDVAGVNRGAYDAAWIQILRTAPKDRWIWFSFAHEPEGDGFTVAAWQQAQMRLAKLKAQYAPTNVRFAPLLMGSTFHASRYRVSATGNVPWSTWFNFDLSNVDAIGADLYQWGTQDATADTAAAVVNPAIEAARSKGKGLVVGELGARNTLTDTGRATFLKDAVKLFDASRNVRAVAYFESDNGSKGPWNLLPKPGTPTSLPKSIAVWKSAVQSSPKS
ncbi:hypothetical protein GCM10023258_01310 [Terrabacter aeriphilus]|uniref:GH26 domain-containing protein n=1 Tax=Terrabacter aeriphilus TaxID=515662 RepID=A0ABP9IZV5_9MICO